MGYIDDNDDDYVDDDDDYDDYDEDDNDDDWPSKFDQGTLVTGGFATAVVASPFAACKTSPSPSAMHSWRAELNWSGRGHNLKHIFGYFHHDHDHDIDDDQHYHNDQHDQHDWPQQEHSQVPAQASSQGRQYQGQRPTSCRWSGTPG